jgi:hypothetical protein
MTYAVILVEKPKDTRSWSNLLSLFENSDKMPQGATRLPGCAWQIDLESAMPFLGTIVHECIGGKLRYAVAYFEQEPRFTSYGESSARPS